MGGGGGKEEGGGADTATKNKNPTDQCGERREREREANEADELMERLAHVRQACFCHGVQQGLAPEQLHVGVARNSSFPAAQGLQLQDRHVSRSFGEPSAGQGWPSQRASRL